MTLRKKRGELVRNVARLKKAHAWSVERETSLRAVIHDEARRGEKLYAALCVAEERLVKFRAICAEAESC